jgi:phosphoribosylamine--glycine ligase
MIIGGGGREHALAWKVARSPRVAEVLVAPGNAGTARFARNLPVKVTDVEGLLKAALAEGVDLTIVGPEAPLAQGLADVFKANGLKVFGPSKVAAELESSKVFSKEIMRRYGVACPSAEIFDSMSHATEFLSRQTLPVVIKADGLAAGKGVTIALTREEAISALSDALEKKAFGTAGARVLIEECLTGREVSLIAVTDGEKVLPMVPACDYKRVNDHDLGPNTGGMGSYSPPGFFGTSETRYAVEKVIYPVIRGMAKEGKPFQGVLYAGLMLTPQGVKVLEFNVRFGDPETQVIIPRLQSDIMDIFLGAIKGRLAEVEPSWTDKACVGVVMASGGYPGHYQTGFPIHGLDDLDRGGIAFHAGTRLGKEPGEALTDGGRVLTITALGQGMAQARDNAYRNVARISFQGNHYRRDIAEREVG